MVVNPGGPKRRNTLLGGTGPMTAMSSCRDWADIPAELLTRALSLLDDRSVIAASGVCTGWRDAVSSSLTRLSLSWCTHNMNKLVPSLSHRFKNLQSLSLRQIKPHLQDDAVEAIANNCHDLLELNLSKSLKLSDKSLYHLAHGCPNLTRLNISGCATFSDSALQYFVSFCKNLNYLNLCGCVSAATDRALKAISQNCRQLQFLNLGWCEDVGDDGVISLANGCPNLRALDLCGCVQITDESIIALAEGCPHLKSLDLYFCQNITDRAMYSLANNRLKRGTRNTTESVPCSDEGLTSLNISQCTALTPPAVQAVCNSFPSLHTCPERHSLIISGCLSLTAVHCACCAHPQGQVVANHAC